MSDRLTRRTLIAGISALAGLTMVGNAALAQPDSHASERKFSDRLVVHEWGTFTELQNEHGQAISGVNTDDEPVPRFVHGFGSRVVTSTFSEGFRSSKRVPFGHPQVTMRLETPVIYFYPPKNQTGPLELDVRVELVNGWLSEYYPNAVSVAPGWDPKRKLERGTVSSLEWNGLKVGTEDRFPDTSDPVWLKPRATQSAGVTTPEGESEKYLFYRGVGNFSGPVQALVDRESGLLRLSSSSDKSEHQQVAQAWLVDIRFDNRVAFRNLGELSLQQEHQTYGSFRFSESDYEPTGLENLKTEMHKALVDEGLYLDEATAMLNTWHSAYFESLGLRIFYIVPRHWTDDQMPLDFSVPAEVERVMIGRIELISDAQRDLIQKLRDSEPSAKWIASIPKSTARSQFLSGSSDFGDLQVEIPEDFKTYMDLGRFRNAMIMAEQAARPCDNLERFISEYRLNWPIGKKTSKVTVD